MDVLYYIGASVSAAIYALILQTIGRDKYEPDFTVVTVMIGVALTGAWVALRFNGPLPTLPANELVWWAWRVMFWMFVATGLPITLWQVWQARERIQRLARYATRSNHGNPTSQAAAVASERRGEPPTGD